MCTSNSLWQRQKLLSQTTRNGMVLKLVDQMRMSFHVLDIPWKAWLTSFFPANKEWGLGCRFCYTPPLLDAIKYSLPDWLWRNWKPVRTGFQEDGDDRLTLSSARSGRFLTCLQTPRKNGREMEEKNGSSNYLFLRKEGQEGIAGFRTEAERAIEHFIFQLQQKVTQPLVSLKRRKLIYRCENTYE